MELLRIKHHDFVMTIECTKFDAIWDKAKRNVGEDKLTSTYSWSDGVEQVERYSFPQTPPISDSLHYQRIWQEQKNLLISPQK